jgi:hypothetical protein
VIAQKSRVSRRMTVGRDCSETCWRLTQALYSWQCLRRTGALMSALVAHSLHHILPLHLGHGLLGAVLGTIATIRLTFAFRSRRLGDKTISSTTIFAGYPSYAVMLPVLTIVVIIGHCYTTAFMHRNSTTAMQGTAHGCTR